MHNRKIIYGYIKNQIIPIKRSGSHKKHEKSREERAIDEILYGDKIFSEKALRIYKSRLR